MSGAWERITPANAPAVLAENKESCLQHAQFEAQKFLDSLDGISASDRTQFVARVLAAVGELIDQHHEKILHRVRGGQIQ